MTLNKSIAITAAVVAVLAGTGAVLTGVTMAHVHMGWLPLDYIRWVATPDAFFLANYLDAIMLTVAIMLLFALLGRFFSEQHPLAAAMANAFVPVFGALNLLCYSLQLHAVPLEARDALLRPEQQYFAFHLIQANVTTLAGFANGLAYTILGIPSLIYGTLFMKSCRPWSGRFLALDGVFCIFGWAGSAVGSAFLANGVLWGGSVFLIAAVCLFFEFRENVRVRLNPRAD